MTAKELFATVLRGFGVWTLLRMLDYWVEAFDISAGLYKPLHDSMGVFATHTVAYFVIGIYLLRGAPHAVEFAFRERRKKIGEAYSDHNVNT